MLDTMVATLRCAAILSFVSLLCDPIRCFATFARLPAKVMRKLFAFSPQE